MMPTAMPVITKWPNFKSLLTGLQVKIKQSDLPMQKSIPVLKFLLIFFQGCSLRTFECFDDSHCAIRY